MGSQESKSAELPPKQINEIKETDDSSVPSTPILTPLDPRSPSTNIARTPLELILGSRPIADSDSVHVSEENGEVIVKNVVLHVDPRSPTVEFNRTPIVVSTIVKNKPKLNNKNFDNVRKSIIQTTPTSTQRSSAIAPKLLSCSPAVYVNPNINKRRSLVGLLETNIDFTETNLDTVSANKEKIIEESPSVEEKEEDSTNQSEEIETLQIESEHDLKSTPEQTPSYVSEEDKNEEEKVTENSILESELNTKEEERVYDNENILEEKSINVTAHVKDFDKKLTNLIYQDESGDDDKLTPRFTKIKENNRTPLGIRNSNEEPKKAVNRLKVSDKPRKTDSKIPVFKDAHTKKITIQCENTPPKKTEEKRVKSKISQWDADKTLII